MKIKIDGQWYGTVTGKNQVTHKTAPSAEYIGVKMDDGDFAVKVFREGKHYETNNNDIPLVKCYGIDTSNGITLKMKAVDASTPA